MNALTTTKESKNLTPAALIEKTIVLRQGQLSSTGALMVKTGKFTGRSPKDRFIVEDEKTKDLVDWGGINQPIAPEHFDALYQKILAYKNEQEEIFVRDAFACANPNYR